MLVIGHRGAAGYAPENTLRSFQAALKFGVDYVEADIQLTRDNQLVVFHDKLLDRVTNASGYVRDFDYSHLKDHVRINGDEKIPLLHEICDLLRGTPVNLMAELLTPGIEEQVLQTLDEHLGEGRYILASFHHGLLRDVRYTRPTTPVLALIEGAPVDPVRMLADCDAQYAGLGFESIHQQQVSAIQAAGISVFVWTINDPREIDRAFTLGVDGIITDYPDRLPSDRR